jgi:hypothetical protein
MAKGPSIFEDDIISPSLLLRFESVTPTFCLMKQISIHIHLLSLSIFIVKASVPYDAADKHRLSCCPGDISLLSPVLFLTMSLI